MSDNNVSGLRVSIEIGDDHEPTPRVAAAIEELTLALAEADDAQKGDEVAGFSFEPLDVKAGFSMGYASPGSATREGYIKLGYTKLDYLKLGD